MPQSTAPVMPSTAEITRFPWMRRLSFISPKLSRLLTVFSYECLDLWAFIESQPAITHFCEYPGYVVLDDQRMLATFWVQGRDHQQFLVLEDDIELEPEHPSQVPTYRDASVFKVTHEWLTPNRQWIDNWVQINSYLVSNSRFVTPQLLDATAALFDRPVALFDAEHELLRIDRQLVRTAIFMLLHCGRLTSADLAKSPLSGATLFSPNSIGP